jgi:hypothetical protein
LQSSRKLDQARDERCADYFNGKMLTFSASASFGPYLAAFSCGSPERNIVRYQTPFQRFVP